MPPYVILIGLWVVTTTVGCVYKHVKGSGKDKIEIMSVRKELKKIDKLNKAQKDSLF